MTTETTNESQAPMLPTALPANDCVTAHIASTDTKSSLGGLQSHTTYKIAICDFGRNLFVERRYDDFNNLHCELLRICGESNLPPMPKKQFFGSLDIDTVEKRKPQLGLIIQTMLKCPEALIEKQNLLWNFLDLPLASVACTRFLQASNHEQKLAYLKQLVKIATEEKYVEDRYRLYYPAVMKEILAFINGAGGDTAEESLVAGMDILKAILKHCAKAREIFFDLQGMHILFKVAARKAETLELCRGVLNAIIISSGDMFPTALCMFLDSGLQLLRDLCTPEADEYFSPFLSKILWIAWEPVTIQKLITPGGLPLLSMLFQSSSIVGRAYVACMLATAMVHGAFDQTAMERAAMGVDGFVIEMLTEAPAHKQLATMETITRTRSSLNRLLPCLKGMETSARLALWIMARVPPKDGFLTPELFHLVKPWAVCQADHTTRTLAARILLHISTKGDPHGSVPWFADNTSFNATRNLLADFATAEVSRIEKLQSAVVERYTMQKSRDQRLAHIPDLTTDFDNFKHSVDAYQTSRSRVAESLSMSDNLLKGYDVEIKRTKQVDLPSSIERGAIPMLEPIMREFEAINTAWEEHHNVEKKALEKVHDAVSGKNEADELVQKGEEKLSKLRGNIADAENRRASLIKEVQDMRVKLEEDKISGVSPAEEVSILEEELKKKQQQETQLSEQRQKWREQEQYIDNQMGEIRRRWQVMSENQVSANAELQACQQKLEEISKKKRDKQSKIEEMIKPIYSNIMNCQNSVAKCEERREEVSTILVQNFALFQAEKEEREIFLNTLRELQQVLAKMERDLALMDDAELEMIQ